MDAFIKYLRDVRRLPEGTIIRMDADKIDPIVIRAMSDDQLARYIDTPGDRIAVRQFCEKPAAEVSTSGLVNLAINVEQNLGKHTEIAEPSEAVTPAKRPKIAENQSASKEMKSYQLIWKNFDRGQFRLVTQNNGGGTRCLKDNKNITIKKIKTEAIKLFFPNRISKFGRVDEFNMKIKDMNGENIFLKTTLIDLYEKYKVKMMKIYLYTKKHESAGPATDPMTSSTYIGADSLESTSAILGKTNGDESLPVIPVTPKRPTVTVKLHRGHVFNDLNDAVKNGELGMNTVAVEVQMLMPNGDFEIKDVSGEIWREALTEYWETFYRQATRGSVVKVPKICHDMKDKWENVATIMVIGHKTVGYFPISIAKPFLEYCLGEDTTDQCLNNAYQQFVPEHEKVFVKSEKYSNDESFRHFLNAHGVECAEVDNWLKLRQELAHKELIQEPAYVSQCWGRILQCHLQVPYGGIGELIAPLIPSTRNVFQHLKFGPNMDPTDRNCAEYLKEFVRNSSVDDIKRFLRFCTGTDILICRTIKVQFVKYQSVYPRTPVGHKDRCVLELLNDYQSAHDMSQDFQKRCYTLTRKWSTVTSTL
ncbi:uncharacterized protein LOC121372542 isoform X2 [Gigantopelta aegis]|uniref:uncharacterized protein LOC121372542 isoform X2 n=1 Tax=Gigantopelta aegis TaxID=1735272 RepID=UPI001B888D75|nr:uncharacterized protein LOC121372542 isoform X2 [Gigantopelta aegis]XP_041354863.1 uncharacterized protein LOC121372542 isoform X2 [Gigantopelta aegis]